MVIMAKLFTQIKLYLLEIPATFVLVPVGLFLEFVITLPFMIICEMDGFFRKKA